MAKQYRQRDDFEWNGGLWLPRGGLRGPDRLRPNSRRNFRFSPGCCCTTFNCDRPECEHETLLTATDLEGGFADFSELEGENILRYCGCATNIHINQRTLCFWTYELENPIHYGIYVFNYLILTCSHIITNPPEIWFTTASPIQPCSSCDNPGNYYDSWQLRIAYSNDTWDCQSERVLLTDTYNSQLTSGTFTITPI